MIKVIGVPGLVRHETHHGDGEGLGGEAHEDIDLNEFSCETLSDYVYY